MHRQIPTTEMTVWYVRRDYVSRVNSHCVGDTLPTKSQRWNFHFSSYLVIELFHWRCFNDYFLLVFHFCQLYDTLEVQTRARSTEPRASISTEPSWVYSASADLRSPLVLVAPPSDLSFRGVTLGFSHSFVHLAFCVLQSLPRVTFVGWP